MMLPILEQIARTRNYGDLPETWRVPEDDRFSREKTLYDYQIEALRNAARALYLYYKNERAEQPDEPGHVVDKRKRDFAAHFIAREDKSHLAGLQVKKYETRTDRRNQRQNPVFRILSEFIAPFGEEIPYSQLINRMCFWMATGSGKTLVMVKLIEYLHRLKERGEIPPHNVLILAPSEHLLGQIRRTVEEFNQAGLSIELVPLRDCGKARQGRLGDHVTVYYHRSDNVSDVQTEAVIDYRRYENGGRWYVLLDEAHKGDKDESKRQAYYAIMAREGFLFNFSATFTDTKDVITTVKKYNLEEFIRNGHGKNIYLNKKELESFKDKKEEISHNERRRIVLRSLITLAYVSRRVSELRESTGLETLYHQPLMLTLVNSVNTDVENERNDLWAFFQTLREIAMGEMEESLFKKVKNELAHEWGNSSLLFGEDGGGIIGTDSTAVTRMKMTDLREAVFLSRRRGAVEYTCGQDNKELAFQMKNADAPFALIRIGDTSKWRKELLAGFVIVKNLKEKSFFDDLERSSITILMGSRSFFESWDSNRPNVINFINIGGKDARKFVVQSVGRGVRIETLPGERRRLAFLPDGDEKGVLQEHHGRVQPPETLFLFATNRAAAESLLKGAKSEESGAHEHVEGIVEAERPKVNGREMALLVPEYKEIPRGNEMRAKFAMSHGDLERLKSWFESTSDSVFLVRDSLSSGEIGELRGMVNRSDVQKAKDKHYANLSFLQARLQSHLSQTGRTTDGIRRLNEQEDIVHFRQIRARLYRTEAKTLIEKIEAVKAGGISVSEKKELAEKFAKGEIGDEEFSRRIVGKTEESFETSNGALKIKTIPKHYYVPIVMAERGKADFIKHIVKEKSEITFLNDLESWLETNKPEWDAWMFSKIDESLDKVHIPYYNADTNEYSRFLPDFIFWMVRDAEYRIVFVDPKGTAHTSAYTKIDGYRKLFEENEKRRAFKYRRSTVKVGLLMFNPNPNAPERYRNYWTNDPAKIFAMHA